MPFCESMGRGQCPILGMIIHKDDLIRLAHAVHDAANGFEQGRHRTFFVECRNDDRINGILAHGFQEGVGLRSFVLRHYMWAPGTVNPSSRKSRSGIHGAGQRPR